MFKNLKTNKLNEVVDKVYSELINNFEEITYYMKIFLNNR